MGQKILLPIDESGNSLRAVNYVAKVSKPEDEITLYSLLPISSKACELDDPSLAPTFKQNKVVYCGSVNLKKDELISSIAKAKEILSNTGIPSKNIKDKLENQNKKIADQIIDEAHQGKYDTIVMGKKKRSKYIDFFIGGVAIKVLLSAKDITVVVV